MPLRALEKTLKGINHVIRPKPILLRRVEAPAKRHNPRVEVRAEAQVRRGSDAGRARVGRGTRAMALRPESYSIMVADVRGAGWARYAPPPMKSGGLPSHNPFAPHPPHSDNVLGPNTDRDRTTNACCS